MNTIQGKTRFSDAALRVIKLLNNETERQQYVQLVADKIGGIATSLNERMQQLEDGPIKEQALKPIANLNYESTYDESSYQDNLLAVALIDSATHDLFTDIDTNAFNGESRQAIVSYIASHPGKAVFDTPADLQNHDTYVKILLLKADARYADWNDQDRYFETARLLRQVANEHKKKQKDLLTEQLRDAETIGNETGAKELRGRINNLIKEIQSGKS
jgi:hypothetical protein